VCAADSMLLSEYLSVPLLRFNTSCPFMILFDFCLLCVEFLTESSAVVARWSYIVFVSVYPGTVLFLH
jgi:hypothetical protein